MATIRVEPEPPIKESRCDACGGTNRLLHGYVYEDEHPHGVYFIEWCDGEHSESTAFLTLGIGAFGDDTARDDRAAFCVEWRQDGMRLSEEPVRDRPDLLGDFIPRREALLMANIEHVWHVADHIVLDDPRLAAVQEWLDRR